ncbi:MAG: Ribosomal large subunit pseudouridine synthase D [Chlamydiae bacterium]|nr:Ribosomal large subunit pseudouridine synthase D [Chlamydiota bacterium]
MKMMEQLPTVFPDSSKATLKKWIKHGRILVDGKVVRDLRATLREGAILALKKKKNFLELEIEVLYEDSDLIVLSKPEGVLSVATAYDGVNTVHGVLKNHYREVYPVHRIDRETSGVMVFALSKEGREGLKELFFHHTIFREYRAIIKGQISGEGTWTSRLKEDANYFVKPHPDGDLSITHYKVLNARGLVKFTLETGRKNQIRAQALEAGFPILGDQKYGGSTNRRLFLHAYRLEFVHPVSGKQMAFKAPIPFAT